MLEIQGFKVFPEWLDPEQQAELVSDVREIATHAPFIQPMTPWGKPMSVRMTSAGRYGWITGKGGYRYEERHPATGNRWPPIPASILQIWDALSGTHTPPDSCLVNHYSEKARMGLHQDKDETDFSFPVVSVSLGDAAVFRMGGTARDLPTQSVVLSSGDVVVMGGAARLAFHGVDRIRNGSSRLLEKGGRINLTLRRVAPAEDA